MRAQPADVLGALGLTTKSQLVLINEQPLEWRSLCPGLRERERESSEEEDRWINLLKIYIGVVERAREKRIEVVLFRRWIGSSGGTTRGERPTQ